MSEVDSGSNPVSGLPLDLLKQRLREIVHIIKYCVQQQRLAMCELRQVPATNAVRLILLRHFI